MSKRIPVFALYLLTVLFPVCLSASPLEERLKTAESYLQQVQKYLEDPAGFTYADVRRARSRHDQARTILDEIIDEPTLTGSQARALAQIEFFDIPTASTLIRTAAGMLDRLLAIKKDGTDLSIIRDVTELNREIRRARTTISSLQAQTAPMLAASQDQLLPIFQELTGLTQRILRIRALLVELEFAPMERMLFTRENFCLLMADFKNTQRVLEEMQRILTPVDAPVIVRPIARRPAPAAPTAADAARTDPPTESEVPVTTNNASDLPELFGMLLPLFMFASPP